MLLYQRQQNLPDAFSTGPASTMWEVASTSALSAVYTAGANSRAIAIEEAYDKRIDEIFAATGQQLANPMRAGDGGAGEFGLDDVSDPFADFDSDLARLAEQFPDHRGVIRSDSSPMQDAYQKTREVERRASDALDRYRGPWGTGTIAQFAGGFVGALRDPVNAVTMFVGPAGYAGAGFKGLAWAAIKNGAANAAVETAVQPAIASWRKEAGLGYGVSDFALNVGAAFALGAGFDATVRGGVRGLQTARGMVPKLDDKGFIQGWQTVDEQSRAAMIDELDKAAANSADATVRNARSGDPQSMRDLADAAGVADDPAVRGALDAAEIDDAVAVRIDGVDDGAHLQRMADLLRHAEDPSNPIPVRPPPVPDAAPVRLADDAPTPTGRQAEVEGKPVYFRPVELKETITDAATFQFKRGGDANGATGRLSGVDRWDQVAAGRAVIFERANGELVVADAHQRRALAVRLEEPTPVEAVVFREADGWAPGDVRALAAKKNLQEGSGSVIDAAAVIRDRPEIIDKSMPLRSDLMRQARSLSRLSDEAFDMVAAGVLPANHAALIGDLVPDKARHASIAGELADLIPANVQQARLYLSEILSAPVHAEEQLTLLGAVRTERSLLRERVGLLDQALKTLRDDARIFSVLTREAERIEGAGNRLAGDENATRATQAAQVEALIERLAMQRGPVSDWLDGAARALASGTAKTQAAGAFVNRVREALEEGGIAGLIGGQEARGAGEMVDDVAGDAGRRQLEDLEREFGDEIEAARDPVARRREIEEGQAQLFALRAFHGSPHRFERFSTDQIGSGEGAQAYGHGLYFAQSKGVAQYYADAVTQLHTGESGIRLGGDPTDRVAQSARDYVHDWAEMIAGENWIDQKAKVKKQIAEAMRADGRSEREVAALDEVVDGASPVEGVIYEVNLRIGDDELLDLDQPLVLQQGIDVDKIYAAAGGSIDRVEIKSGEQGWQVFVNGKSASEWMGSKADAELAVRRGVFDPETGDLAINTVGHIIGITQFTDRLQAAGFKGIKYFDQVSRDQGDGTRNFVVFNEADVEIVAINGEPVAKPVQFSITDPGSYRVTDAASARAPEIRAEIDRIAARLPDGVRMRVEDRLVYGLEEIDGRFDPHDAIAYVSLAAADPAKVARHEEVHALRDLGLFSDREWQDLIDYARANDLRKAYKIDERYGEPYQKLFKQDAEARLLEETVAHMVADYNGGRRFGGALDRVLQVVTDFLRQVRDALGLKGFRTVADIFEDIESGAVGRRRQVDLPGGGSVEGLQLFALRAFHGSPHRFDRFSTDQIGTGEGAQAYGHGLYFAESEGVARSYADAVPYNRLRRDFQNALPDDADFEEVFDLVGTGHFTDYQDRVLRALRADDWLGFDYPSQAISAAFGKRLLDFDPSQELVDAVKASGVVYEVQLRFDAEDLVDWDLPISQQSDKVRALFKTEDPRPVKQWMPKNKQTSDWFLARGIKGIRYLDHSSRNFDLTFADGVSGKVRDAAAWAFRNADDLEHARRKLRGKAVDDPAAAEALALLDDGSIVAQRDGTRNVVVFNDADVEIVAINGEPVQSLRGDLAASERVGEMASLVTACKR